MNLNHTPSSLINNQKSNALTAVQIVYNIILILVNYHKNQQIMFTNALINVLQINHSNKVYIKVM